MNTLQYFLSLYRLWRPLNGRIKAAQMALREASKPVPF
jgi:hypothetical protein